METLIALEGILLKAIPTFCLIWILYFYVSRFFLAPLERTLHQRHESTEGLRKAAEVRVSQAEQKTATYQEALRSNSAEIYRQQEQERQKSMAQRAEALRQARARAEEHLARARQEIAQEAEAAKKQLESESEQMAQWIARAILEPPTAAASSPGGTTGIR
jgi:F0F1-type ATP synthase membrane subunit b/b'